MFVIFNLNNDVIQGYTDDSGYIPAHGSIVLPVPADYDESDRDAVTLIDGALVIDAAAKLAKAKSERIARIKREAATMIAATDWRVTRAQEQAALMVTGVESVEDVLRAREAIRRASNRAESEVAGLASVAAVQAYTWGVTPADEIEEAPPF